MMDCPRCWGTGWTAHDCQCWDCDGTGEVDSDPFLDGADRLYMDEKERGDDDDDARATLPGA